ncbi:hypothetical protein GF362_04625 [Candidatus Dojkabacteria bacterium]|nr:hypothetical protein [Candidatus Dojkabacteria bacterium]
MINKSSVQTVDQSNLNKVFKKPLYNSYSFNNITGSILKIFGKAEETGLPSDVFEGFDKKYKKVVFILIDAFGWNMFERNFERIKSLKNIAVISRISKLTSQFPSTTSAQITTLNTGLSVGESGIYEWRQYSPKLDRIILPLKYCYLGDKEKYTILEDGIDPEDIFPRSNFYKKLKDSGVIPFTLNYSGYADSPFNQVVNKDTENLRYNTYSEALVKIRDLIKTIKVNSFIYLYLANVDSLVHMYGPDTSYVDAEIESYFTLLENLLLSKLNNERRETLFIITSDHGQVATNPETTIYLNQKIPGIEEYIERNNRGEILIPAGSPRDFFLHIKKSRVEEAVRMLSDELFGKAEVYKTSELIKKGLFGPVNKEFKNIVGNVVILPYVGETVWWYEQDKFEVDKLGGHGGLTKQEMEIPFILFEL